MVDEYDRRLIAVGSRRPNVASFFVLFKRPARVAHGENLYPDPFLWGQFTFWQSA